MNRMAWVLLILTAAAHAGENPSVLVKTEPVHQQALVFELSAYGTVIPDVSSMVNINFPLSGQISRLNVTPGQIVRRGETLFEFVTDPIAANNYAQAESALEFAQGEFVRIKRQFEQQLATNSQLAAAKKALLDAESAARAQKKLGAGIHRDSVTAPFDGVVTALSVTPGDRIQAGKSAVQLARRDSLRVQMGIQPEDASRVKAGMPVKLNPVFGSLQQLQGVVGEVHGMINPQTRLVDVFVKIDKAQGRGLVPGMQMRGTIEVRAKKTWVVPRSAVLTDEQGDYIYQNDHGHAKRVNVTSLDNGRLVGISGRIDPGLPVVVLGNYELQDGMALREAGR